MVAVCHATVARATSPIADPVSKIGGLPVFVDAAEWPRCPGCGRVLEFWFQIRLDTPLPLSPAFAMAYIFACPGERDNRQRAGCRLWPDPPVWRDHVGTVVLQRPRITPFTPRGVAAFPDYALRFERGEEPDEGIVLLAEDLDDAHLARFRGDTKLGGSPVWWHTARSPRCPACGGAMRFVFQLRTAQEGLDIDLDGANFGWGYVFICERSCDTNGALMLWQHD
ncbi:MAG: hypothetical protein ACJ8DJ_02170 [Gemmatimonadales bacterium]